MGAAPASMTSRLQEKPMEVTEAERAPELVSSSSSIDLFCDALWLEHGLAKNSLEAYRRDLRLFSEWLSKTRGGTVDTATEADMNGYLAARRADKATSEPPVIGLQALLRVGIARTSSARRSYA